MKFLVLLVASFAAILARPSYAESVAGDCKRSVCKIEDNCRCSSGSGPYEGSITEYPQLITITIDEAVSEKIYDLWFDILAERENPDGNPVGATFFVPHEYTDYQRVNDLFNLGFEIGVHSISKNPLQSYWREATEELLVQEFAGQKEIISTFANIPKEHIQGVRTPQLQLAGNISISAYRVAELSYDSSWPTLPKKPLFPYTLDYKSTQQCNLGNVCPNEAFPGFWVLPIIDLNSADGGWCNNLATCNATGSADDIANWLGKEIDLVKSSSRAPLTISISSYWFDQVEESRAGFNKWLDNLAENKDTFLVTQKQVIEWMKNPVKLDVFETADPSEQVANCNENSCSLDKGSETRYMNACTDCPSVYPWLGNPNGDSK